MVEQPQTQRILIVDDHPLVRDGLALQIASQRDLSVFGAAESSEEALRLIEHDTPDAAIIDLRLKEGHGIELVRQIKTRCPSIRVLVMTGLDESLYGERALRAGALGFLGKHESNERLLEAIRTVLRGERYLSPALSQRILGLALEGSAGVDVKERLTDRELEIFRLIGKGLSSGAIAEQLFLSRHTVDSHRENIKRKVGARTAGELSRLAVEWVLEAG